LKNNSFCCLHPCAGLNKIALVTPEFQGHHTNQACYKSGIMSPNTGHYFLSILSIDNAS
jgi:hypothetical protein